MANKFGKFLLVTAAASAIAITAYHFIQKNDLLNSDDEDIDDFDDFDDLEDDVDLSSRTYVPLNRDVANTTEESAVEAPTFSVVEEEVEEFFDDGDDSEEEPTIKED